jgi:hypothetical protein
MATSDRKTGEPPPKPSDTPPDEVNVSDPDEVPDPDSVEELPKRVFHNEHQPFL